MNHGTPNSAHERSANPDVMTKASKVSVLASLVRILVLAPLTGAMIGCILAHVAFNSRFFWGQSTVYSGLGITSSFGIPFGAVVGGVCGLLSFWPLRRMPLLKVGPALCGSTLLFGLPAACAGNPGAILSLVMSFLGFWVGFCYLYFDADPGVRTVVLETGAAANARDERELSL